jgi:SAM-dependent methyltransferase
MSAVFMGLLSCLWYTCPDDKPMLIRGYNMNNYWDNIWCNPDVNKYIGYVKGYLSWKPKFMEIFTQYGVKKVCDAACGFGAYSVMLAKNGFNVSGFDISVESVYLTQNIMEKFDCAFDEYKVCGITKINYDDESFCAVAAHAVIDHVPLADVRLALAEMFRVLSPGGLLYITFDPLNDEDEGKKHDILADGSRLYEDGLLFRHYTNDDINMLLNNKKTLYSNTNTRGEREYVLQK